MKSILKEYHIFLKERYKEDIAVFIIELVYVLFCIGSAIYFAATGYVQNSLMSLVFPLIVLLMCLLEWRLKFRGGALLYILFFFMCLSNILGNGYGLYELYKPYFDKIMHTISGLVFTCLGYTLMKMALKDDKGKNFAICLMAGVIFAMALAALWEVFEYFVTAVLHDDMQTNYTVYTIDYIKEISQTIIYYTDGSFVTVDGYIDIGLFDTLQDITVCLVGGSIVLLVLIVDHFCFKSKINKLLIPKILPRESARTAELDDENLATA